ncbi:hypothetical protein, partial [Arthrobacter sedimenti]
YIIGINKLGTLLSSQTTDTPGTTQTKHSGSLRSNFSNLPDPPQLCKPAIQRTKLQKNRAPPITGTPQKRTIFQAVIKGGWPLFFRFSGGDSENNTRTQPPPQIGHSMGKIRGIEGHERPLGHPSRLPPS